jgi:hypothetical protein
MLPPDTLLLIPAVFLFGVSLALMGLGIMGAILTVVLRIIAGVLWVAIKIVEHRKAEPEILIIIEDDEPPMRDITPRPKAINAPRAARGN